MKNKVAVVLKSIAWWTFGLGFIMGFFASSIEVPSFTSNFEYVTNTEFSLTILLAIWGSSFVSGMLFLGFAEIIELLQQLVNRSVSKEQLQTAKIDEENYKKEKLYNELIRKKSIATTIPDLEIIKSQFETINDYNDVQSKIFEVDEKINKLKNEINLEQEKKEQNYQLNIKIKEEQDKLKIEKHEKRIHFLKSNLKIIIVGFTIILIVILMIFIKNETDQRYITNLKNNWEGTWAPSYSYGQIRINFTKNTIDICIPDVCEYDVKVKYNIEDGEIITFVIKDKTYELKYKEDDIANLSYAGREMLIKRVSDKIK